ncbi:hypothetical protein ACVWY3_005083 [Bradyrhizobium sp. USDA 4486]
MQKTREVTADRSALLAIMSAHVSSFLLGIRNAQERVGMDAFGPETCSEGLNEALAGGLQGRDKVQLPPR